MQDYFDWEGIEEKKGKLLCSACSPSHYSDGAKVVDLGVWHGEFKRTFLPMGEFKTNKVGNLEHIESGDTDYRKYEICQTRNQ